MKLNSLITKEFRTTIGQRSALEKLGLMTIEDLLFHFPVRYIEPGKSSTIDNLQEKQSATIYGTVKKAKVGRTFRGHKPMAEIIVSDGNNQIRAVWFNQPYIAKLFTEGVFVRLDGITSAKNKNGDISMINPKIEKVDQIPLNESGLFQNENSDEDLHMSPIYSESKGVTSNWFYHTIQKILRDEVLEELNDPVPTKIIEKYNLPSLRTALIWIHIPRKSQDAISARKRFAFEEIFYIQIQKQLSRKQNESLKSVQIKCPDEKIEKFIQKFPFKLTDSQTKAIESVMQDLESPAPMSRLLEGDVGSGKTAVAATAAFATVMTPPPGRKFGYSQVAYMVPTEILAKQHFENFIQFFDGTDIEIGLITGSGCFKYPSKTKRGGYTKISKTQLLNWIKKGQIPMVVGTHSLIQKTVEFQNLALVIIDEQHRFGTKQRQQIAQKEGFTPHLLSMTATPIPRTLALTIYGDLDLTLIDQMPTGRKPIITEIVTPGARSKTYDKIRTELKAGRQAFVICPRIDEPDPEKQNALYTKSVMEESQRLQNEIFPDYKIDIMHSRMKPDEKASVMKMFSDGEIDILVSTSVVEVGVNIPNATNIIIEGAERFGLAQLHQLRGRVLRSNHQAYCYIFTNSKNEYTLERLKMLSKAKNGFELAEFDLKLRGAGELIGGKQWGISDIGMEAIKNLKMVEAAREEAKNIVAHDWQKQESKLVRLKISQMDKIHFE